MGGNGAIDLQGPLAALWRDVYQKAGAVADARAQALLKYHVYTYPHGAGEGGSGGGGGFPLLASTTCTGGEQSVRLPASGSLPTGFHGLLLVVQARAATATGTSTLFLRLNGDTAANYRHVEHYARASGQHGAEGEIGTPSTAGYLGRLATASVNSSALQVWLPFAARSAFWQAYQSDALNDYYAGTEAQLQHDYGLWMQAAAVTDLTVYATGGTPGSALLEGGLAAGSHLAVYGVGGSGGGGGGGTTDVVITTDASLTVSESPAETFALAARISVDAGNALSLHANGLYATDTGGGGGTGNTTMYTQTSTPTGAANSLWFNPSESA